MILVLIISMIIAFCIKDWISGGVIAMVVFLNIVVGFIQEYKAEKTMGSLKSLSLPLAQVTRDNELLTIPAKELVPGDIVHIKMGDTIPADLRLFKTLSLETDEALLTGESLPVAKIAETLEYSEKPIPVGDRLNIAYSSSNCVKGRGMGIVVATGFETEIGKIASSLQEKKSFFKFDENSSGFQKYGKMLWTGFIEVGGNILGTNVGTPLQRKLSWLAIVLFWVAVLFAIVVMASQKMNVDKDVAIYAICVALSMIPSSLIVVLTITMAVGAQVMVQKHVIVRRLDSLEALGGINDICSDKTGTLTQGKMIVKKVWIPSLGTYSVENCTQPINPEVGDLKFSSFSPQSIRDRDEETDFQTAPALIHELFEKWLVCASLANVAEVFKPADSDEWTAHGDATEIALNIFTTREGFTRAKVAEGADHVHEFPFDSLIKRMSSIYKLNNCSTATIYTKGAVEKTLPLCTNWFENDQEKSLSEEHRKAITENMSALSSQGLRVLAFAQRLVKSGEDLTNRESVESNLSFLGLVGIYDPPRIETADSIKKCHRAGIDVHMLTGDHPETAKAIALEVGILPHNLYHYGKNVVKAMCMTATEFDELTDLEVDALPILPLVIARCAPQTKVKMIDALHRRKKFTAMTGDGVNDSPSLKKSDVGIAMGLNGSDVTKDVSDIVLTDDNFASIVNAIEEGRRMTANIRKFVLQLLAENVCQALYLMIGLAFVDLSGRSVFPLSPVEVLWVIVVTSCFPAMGLGQEAASDDILNLAPDSTIFTRELIIDMIGYGLIMTVSCLCCFVVIVFGAGNGELGMNCNNDDNETCNLIFRGRAASFTTMVWCALLLSWECLHPTNSLFNMSPDLDKPWWHVTWTLLTRNKFLLYSIGGGFVSVFPVVYIPVINTKVFLHRPITWEWALALGFVVVFFAGCEAWKWGKRICIRHYTKTGPAHLVVDHSDPFRSYATSFSVDATFDKKKNMS